QIIGLAVELAGTGEDDFDRRIVFPAGFEDRELSAAIDLQVGVGVAHRIHVAGLTGEVEQIILLLHEVTHAVGVAHVGDVHLNQWLDARDCKKVATLFRYEAVNQKHARADGSEPSRQIRADESQRASDQHATIGKCAIQFHDKILSIFSSLSAKSQVSRAPIGPTEIT